MTRPLPDTTDELSEAYWQGTRSGELRVQECTSCGYRRWPPARRCPECLGQEHRVVALVPEGTIWSFATYERSFHPAFDDRLPYVVALVEVVPGIIMIGNIVGDETTAVGAAVTAVFDPVTPEVTLVHWRVRPGVTDPAAARSG